MNNRILKMVGRFAGFAGLIFTALIISQFVVSSANAQNKAASMKAGKKAAASKKAGKNSKNKKKSKDKEEEGEDDEHRVVKLAPRMSEFKAGEPISKTANTFGVTPAIRNVIEANQPQRDFEGEQSIRDEENNEIEVDRIVDGAGLGNKPFSDPLAMKSRERFSILSPQVMPGPALSFNGILSADLLTIFGTTSMPPDTVGDVGPNHYVQATNFGVFRVYSKNGTSLTPIATISTLFSGLPAGDVCRTQNNGDPVVNYDPLADRWLVSQFYSTAPYGQCIAVSRTGDPTGAWYAYNFPAPNPNFADYPHMSVWTDGYYLATHEFGGTPQTFKGGGFYAFNRNKMLIGDPTAEFIYFADPNSFGHLPTDIDGYMPPPAGTSQYFMEYDATVFGGTDSLVIHELVPNFTTPANSTFTLKPRVGVAAFDPRNPSGRADIEQPGSTPANTGPNLDALGTNNMFRLAYRNLGTVAAPINSYVTNWTVNVSGVAPTTPDLYQAASRWEELRRDNTGALSVFDQGTHAPDPVSGTGRNRWMGSIAQDNQGNIALGFSRSGPGATEFPDIVWAGRTGGQTPAGALNEGETTMHASTGVQSSGNRWGDYSAMTVDPTDDCTFWFTTEWREAVNNGTATNNPFKWSTRIGNFKFPTCSAAPKGQISANVTNCDTGLPVNGASLVAQAGGFLRNTNASGNLISNIIAGPGAYTLSAFRKGYTGSTTTNVSVTDGLTTNGNVCLTGGFTILELITAPVATPVDENGNTRLDPGEIATLNIPLRNDGGLDANNTTATLSTTTPGVIILPQQTLPYSDIVKEGGTGNTATPFRFKLDRSFVCGSPINFTLTVNYNGTTAAKTFNFTVVTVPPVSVSTTLDTTPPPTNMDYIWSIGTQTGRLARNGVVSNCAAAKAAPGLQDSTPGRRYDAYRFTASAAGCITVTVSSPGSLLYTAAYNNAGYDPSNPTINFLGDPGTSSTAMTYSFNVTAGQQFTVVVHEVTPNTAPAQNYTLSLSGPVTQACQTFISSFEGDVASRPNGDSVYQSTDPSLIEQFLVGGASMDPSVNEFQRADVAPYASKGDGILDITDVNLAEQYLISAVAQQTAGGPLSPAGPIPSQESLSSAGSKVNPKAESAALLPRVVRASNVTTSAGQTVTVPILVDAEGDETGYSFTLDYNPQILTNTAVTVGNVGGTRAFVIGTTNPNDGVADGKTTFSVRNFPNTQIAAGNGQILVNVTFQVAAGAPAGTTPLTFSGMPTPNSVTNANSQLLATTFAPGQVNITGPSAAGASIGGRVISSNGRGINRATVTLTDADGSTRQAVTSAFGYYRFEDVAAGQTYIVSVEAKRYRFVQSSRTVSLNADDDSINFIGSGF